MMNMKMKSVFKIVCCISAVVIFCYIEGKYNIITKRAEKSGMAGRKILQADFEVFGIVQGVFFRKNTDDAAKRFNIRGWCMNTRDGTVKGVIEGEEAPFNEMKYWLSKVGSSQSRIDKAVFSEPKILSDFTFPGFDIRRVAK